MPLNLALLKGCDIRGVFWGAWTALNAEKNRANLAKLVQWTAEGKISSHVDRTFPLAQTADALKVLAGRKAMGKVILHPLIGAEPSVAVYSTLSRLPSRGRKCGDDESSFHIR